VGDVVVTISLASMLCDRVIVAVVAVVVALVEADAVIDSGPHILVLSACVESLNVVFLVILLVVALPGV